MNYEDCVKHKKGLPQTKEIKGTTMYAFIFPKDELEAYTEHIKRRWPNVHDSEAIGFANGNEFIIRWVANPRGIFGELPFSDEV